MGVSIIFVSVSDKSIKPYRGSLIDVCLKVSSVNAN